MTMHIRGPLYVSGVPTQGMGSRLPATTGNIFFVDSGAADANDNTEWGKTVDQPFSTIDYAVGRCTASNGDVIIVMPGHVDTLTTAGDGAAGLDLDVAGITVVGLGVGRNRPLINMGTVAGCDIDVDAANITLENVQIDMTLLAAGLTAAIDVNAADFTLRDCEIITADAAGEAILGVIVTGDRCTVEGNTFRGTADAGTTAQIDLDGTNDGLVIRGNYFIGACAGANITASTAHTGVQIIDNHFQNLTAAAHAMELTGAVTGVIARNTVITSIYGNAIDPGSCACFENLWYDSDLIASDLSGILVPSATPGGAAAAAAEIVVSGKFPPQGPTARGSIYYVDANASGAATNGGSSPQDAVALLQTAVDLCVADQGDIIYVMPDHTEVHDNTDDLDLDCAGITIIGLGNGVKRPEFTYSTHIAATCVISANNVRLVNFYFDVTGYADITDAVTVTGADVTIERCEFLLDDGTAAKNGITTNAARTRIKDCIFAAPAANLESAIENTGTADGFVVEGCYIHGDYSEACIDSATLHTNCLVRNNVLSNANAGSHAIQFDTAASTGFIINNVVSTDAIGTSIDPGSCVQSGNTFTDVTDIATGQPAQALPVPRGGMPGWNFILNSLDMSTGGTTTETVAEHEVFTVTGLVRCRLLIYVSEVITSSGTPDFDVGVTGALAFLQTRLIDMTSLDAVGPILNTGAASITHAFTVADGAGAVDKVMRDFVTAGADIGYTIIDDAVTGGTLEFCLWWAPISDNGLVVAADGSAGAI